MLWTRLGDEKEGGKEKKKKKNHILFFFFSAHSAVILLCVMLLPGSDLAAFKDRRGHETKNLLWREEIKITEQQPLQRK